jgi:hypothetical protein
MKLSASGPIGNHEALNMVAPVAPGNRMLHIDAPAFSKNVR